MILDFHGWRGFAWERDLLHWKLIAGFFTLMLAHFVITDTLRELGKQLKELEDILKGKEEGR